MMLLCVGVGLAPAFKMRFWNIGAEGQILVGGILHRRTDDPPGRPDLLHPHPALPHGPGQHHAAGALWGLVPAIFKSRWNTNETLFTLMMNYVAIQLTSYCVALWENPCRLQHRGRHPPADPGRLVPARSWARTTPAQRDPGHGPHRRHVPLPAHTPSRATRSPWWARAPTPPATPASSSAGSTSAPWPSPAPSAAWRASSAVAGAGHTISADTAGGRGFTAIIVAWLAQFNTFVMVLIAFLLAFLEKGAIRDRLPVQPQRRRLQHHHRHHPLLHHRKRILHQLQAGLPPQKGGGRQMSMTQYRRAVPGGRRLRHRDPVRRSWERSSPRRPAA